MSIATQNTDIINKQAYYDLFYPYFNKFEDYFKLEGIINALEEITEDQWLIQAISGKVQDVDDFTDKSWPHALCFNTLRVFAYVIARATQPKIILETGVLHGMTSAFFLYGMEKNNAGELLSIDYPSTKESGPVNQDGYTTTLPNNKSSGWVIDEKLHPRWDLHLGKSVDLIPILVKDHPEIDIFCHDSEHTYETMSAEFSLIWPHIKPGGFLIADNIDCDTAFFNFCSDVNRHPVLFCDVRPLEKFHHPKIRFGVIRK